jgi:hypothetical protein
MQSEFFSEQSVQHLSNDVLLRCVAQFRQAIGMLERNGLTEKNRYIQEMRDGLCNMEAELSRRQLTQDTQEEWLPSYSKVAAPHFPMQRPR